MSEMRGYVPPEAKQTLIQEKGPNREIEKETYSVDRVLTACVRSGSSKIRYFEPKDGLGIEGSENMVPAKLQTAINHTNEGQPFVDLTSSPRFMWDGGKFLLYICRGSAKENMKGMRSVQIVGTEFDAAVMDKQTTQALLSKTADMPLAARIKFLSEMSPVGGHDKYGTPLAKRGQLKRGGKTKVRNTTLEAAVDVTTFDDQERAEALQIGTAMMNPHAWVKATLEYGKEVDTNQLGREIKNMVPAAESIIQEINTYNSHLTEYKPGRLERLRGKKERANSVLLHFAQRLARVMKHAGSQDFAQPGKSKTRDIRWKTFVDYNNFLLPKVEAAIQSVKQQGDTYRDDPKLIQQIKSWDDYVRKCVLVK